MTVTLLSEHETRDVLATAARADKRTIAPEDIEFWQLALRGLRHDECNAAVVEHYTHSTDYVMPKHVRGIVEGWRRDSRHSTVPAAQDGDHCGRPSCVCTHTAPCDHGWISADASVPGPTSLTAALHCPTCHPGRRQEPDENRRQWQARLQEQDAAWDRKQRRTDG